MNVLRHITKQPIRIALVVSLLIHAAALWKMPALRSPQESESSRTGPLIVQLAPLPGPSARPPPVRAQRPQIMPPPRAPERAPARPPVMARKDPAPAAPPAPRTQPAPAPAVPAPSPAADLASYIEARRLARGEHSPAPAAPAVAAAPAPAPAEDENARANRIAAANLGLDRAPKFGPERRSGGLFDVTYLGYDYAEFMFYGWSKDIRRNTAQKIEVRKGQNRDIRIAVVRRMIVIIREYEKEDFTWQSHRLNRDVMLSARLRDTAGLEDFLMREFFDEGRRPAAAR